MGPMKFANGQRVLANRTTGSIVSGKTYIIDVIATNVLVLVGLGGIYYTDWFIPAPDEVLVNQQETASLADYYKAITE